MATTKKSDSSITYDKLIKLHRETKKEGFSWVSAEDIKKKYSLRNGTLESLQRKYQIPMIHMDKQTHAIYSLPALEYVLQEASELHGTHHDDTVGERLQVLQLEEEEAVRQKLRNEFEAKISAPI